MYHNACEHMYDKILMLEFSNISVYFSYKASNI